MALQPPVDLSHHFSYVTKNRQTSKIKQFYKYLQAPGVQNLAGGIISQGNMLPRHDTPG